MGIEWGFFSMFMIMHNLVMSAITTVINCKRWSSLVLKKVEHVNSFKDISEIQYLYFHFRPHVFVGSWSNFLTNQLSLRDRFQ